MQYICTYLYDDKNVLRYPELTHDTDNVFNSFKAGSHEHAKNGSIFLHPSDFFCISPIFFVSVRFFLYPSDFFVSVRFFFLVESCLHWNLENPKNLANYL
jgi:hypothetical protein